MDKAPNGARFASLLETDQQAGASKSSAGALENQSSDIIILVRACRR
jgi:hypothetical protein